MIPQVPLYLTLDRCLSRLPMVSLGDDFCTRFCTQPLAWFNSGYSSCAKRFRQCCSTPRPTCSWTETCLLLTPNASVRGSPDPARRPVSSLTIASSLLASKAPVTQERSSSPKSYDLPVANVIAVCVKRLRHAEVFFQPSSTSLS